jgi:hypothetical protein
VAGYALEPTHKSVPSRRKVVGSITVADPLRLSALLFGLVGH